MKRLLVTALLCITTIHASAASTNYENKFKLVGTGLLLPWDGKEFASLGGLNEKITIYNIDQKTIYGEIAIDGPEDVYLNTPDGRTSRPDIRSFYPDYSIYIFDAKKVDGGYHIYINNGWKFIKKNSRLTYMDWAEFMVNVPSFYVRQGYTMNLYDTIGGAVVKNIISLDDAKNKATYYTFDIKEIKGDWAFVECKVDCGYCGNSNTASVKGWVKWRNGGELTLDLRYIC